MRFDPTESPFDQLDKNLRVLLKLGTEINEAMSSESLQQLVLERILELVPADNAAIVLASARNELIPSSAVVRRKFSETRLMPVSRTVARMVMESGQSVLRNRVDTDNSAAVSLKEAQVRSVLCIPLTVRGTRLGVIYLNTTVSEKEFNQSHVDLVTAIGGIAAVALEHMKYVEWLEAQNDQYAHEVEVRHDMVGLSREIKKLVENIGLVAEGTASVLILGESGTGKELVARAIHENSDRRLKPFVAVNCAAISESLFSSELFGHVRGAFTGADRDRKGFFEEADGGTLFLDEIGELPLTMQSKLLRVIQEREIIKVGSTKPIKIDVRLISATNRSIENEVKAGRFREDLSYRLGLPIEVPPLRKRLEDVPLLVQFFLDKYRHLARRELQMTPPETLEILQSYHWPGNVRELSVAIEWAVVFGKSDRIRPDDLPKNIYQRNSFEPKPARNLDDAKQSYERQLIIRALEETRGVVSEAAVLLDRVPTYLQRRISQLGLRDELKRIRTS